MAKYLVGMHKDLQNRERQNQQTIAVSFRISIMELWHCHIWAANYLFTVRENAVPGVSLEYEFQ